MNENSNNGLSEFEAVDLPIEERFYREGDEFMVRVNETSVSWSPARHNPDDKWFRVDLRDVLSVRIVDNFKDVESRDDTESTNKNSSNAFEINFVFTHKRKCRIRTIVFTHSDASVIVKRVELISQLVASVSNRPKRLLLFLNPYSGRKRGVEIYEKYVQPLLRLAEIKITLVVTERVKHAYDYLVENGWQDADGIVSVGGDGTFSEVVNGIVKRTADESGIDLNDSNLRLPSTNIRLGTVPAGSTDTIAYSLHGTSDTQTAVIRIITGDFVTSDLCSVHSEKSYLCCFVSLMSYGYLGDVIKNSISLRWMGPLRYDCAGARHFIQHKAYEGTVSYLRESKDNLESKVCTKNDCNCAESSRKFDAEDDGKWEEIRGKFFMVTAANISCACSRSPNGIAPFCHFADGCLSLLLIRRITFCEKLKLLLTLSHKRKLVNSLNFVEIYKTRRFKFETGFGSGIIPATKISSWNIDGELMQTPHLDVHCHHRVINLFCQRGLQR